MTEYFYLKNAQGDIIGITNVLGDIKARYTYDPWGKVISVEKTLAQYDRDIVEMNPLLYRGYVYDREKQISIISKVVTMTHRQADLSTVMM